MTQVILTMEIKNDKWNLWRMIWMVQYNLGKVVGSDGQQGAKGDDGNGIASITKTGTSGLVDTYTITFTDGTSTTFSVTNGSNATVTIQTSWGNPTSDSKVPSEKLVKEYIDGLVGSAITYIVGSGN